MFSSTLSEEVRAVQEDIDAVAERIDNPSICQKIDKYVNAPFEVQTVYRRDAGEQLQRSKNYDGQPGLTPCMHSGRGSRSAGRCTPITGTALFGP